jgi:hypothetical protein
VVVVEIYEPLGGVRPNDSNEAFLLLWNRALAA